MHRQLIPYRRHRSPAIALAMVGVMASASLLAAWEVTKRTGVTARPAESVLLEFLITFVTTFAAVVVAAWIVGVLPIRAVRRR